MSHFNHFPPGTLSDACRQNSIIDPSGKSVLGWEEGVRSNRRVFFDGNCQGSSNGTIHGKFEDFSLNSALFGLVI